MVRWDEGLCFLCVWSTAALLHSFHPIFFSILLNSVRFYSPPFSFSMAVAKVGRPREAASRKVKEWGSNLTRLMFSSIAEVKLPVLVRRRHLKGFFLRLWRLPCAYYDRASFALFQRNRISGGSFQILLPDDVNCEKGLATNSIFFCFLFVKTHRFAWRANQWPLIGEALFSSVLPATPLSMVLLSLLKGFLSWHVALQGPSTLNTCIASSTTEYSKPGGPRPPWPSLNVIRIYSKAKAKSTYTKPGL